MNNGLARAFLWLLCCGFIATFATFEAAAQTPGMALNPNAQKHRASETVQLTATIASQQYCMAVVDAQTSYAKLRLKLKLALRNVSNEPLIVHRYGGNIYRVLLRKNLANSQARDYLYDEHYSFMRSDLSSRRDFSEAMPTDEFQILKPNEFSEYDREIDISLTDLAEPERSLRPGNYLLEIKTQTWQWPVEKALELQQRWAGYGYFWYHDVQSLPMPLRIEKQGATTVVCQ